MRHIPRDDADAVSGAVDDAAAFAHEKAVLVAAVPVHPVTPVHAQVTHLQISSGVGALKDAIVSKTCRVSAGCTTLWSRDRLQCNLIRGFTVD